MRSCPSKTKPVLPVPKLLTSSTNRKQELTLSSCVSLIETTYIPSHVMAASPESNSFSVLQDAEFPKPSYVPGFHVTALVSSEVRVALSPMSTTSTHSHAPVHPCFSFSHTKPCSQMYLSWPCSQRGSLSSITTISQSKSATALHFRFTTATRSENCDQVHFSITVKAQCPVATNPDHSCAIIEYELPLFSCIKLRMLCNVLTIWNPPLWKRLCSCLVD